MAVRVFPKTGKGQLTASAIHSKCSLIKITVSQASEFIVALNKKLIFEKKEVLLFHPPASGAAVALGLARH